MKNLKDIRPLEDFDWSSLGKNAVNYSQDEQSKMSDAYDKSFNVLNDSEVIEGVVVAKNNREVVVNIGFKSDGIIPIAEFRYNPDLKVGDKVEVYVENQEDSNGQLILSHKTARFLKSWERALTSFEKGEIINGYVKSRTKGGLIIDVYGIEAFLPGSQIDVKPIRDYDVYVDKIMEFKIVKVNHEFKNIVVSHKALIEDEIEAQKVEIMAGLEKGQVLEGVVKNITSYGAFVDLGGIDGLVHITDISWGRINHPEEIISLDEKLKVVILDFDESKKRIALGLKQLTPHPWESLDANLQPGDKVKGKVVVVTDYGAFIEIIPGVEGLIHVTEMSWSQHLRTAHDFLKVGDEVEAAILTLDREERKMSLGIKQLMPDPWINIAEKYPVGSKHEAVVRNFTTFGIFVELDEGIDGLIHISDLSWSKKIKHPAEFTKVGEKMQVVVLEVNPDTHKLSLGHKQLEDNPWDVFESIFTVGSVHKGTVVSMQEKGGAIIALPYGVEGLCPKSQLQKEDKSKAKIEDQLDFVVREFSKDNKKIILSHTRTWKQEEPTAERNITGAAAMKKNNDAVERTTLGDLDAFASLKEEMMKAEENVTEKKPAKRVKKEVEPKVEEAEPKVEETEAKVEAAEPEVEVIESVAEPVEAVVEEPAKEEPTQQPEEPTEQSDIKE
ncbi:MAG: 30S ribosomal protein S1 [Bacteroidales bacterium]|jgi:small subunit ribosomal protein S1|nr:30S ribosomal protein S1 [Bacteroidales bacterium]